MGKTKQRPIKPPIRKLLQPSGMEWRAEDAVGIRYPLSAALSHQVIRELPGPYTLSHERYSKPKP